MEEDDEITLWLRAAGLGDPEAAEAVFRSVYPRLRELARARLRRGGPQTLNTTALVHEVWLKGVGAEGSSFESRGHFFATAARAMRHVLVNRAEARQSQKRGAGARAQTLHEDQAVSEEPDLGLLDLDRALQKLEKISPRQGRVVECLFFVGFTIDETAEALAISPATVKRDWDMAKAWLFREMSKGDTRPPR